MNAFARNLTANLTGLGWIVVVQLVCVPFYLSLMGIESYALVGFYLTLHGVLQILDLGLSPTMNREMARRSAQNGAAADSRDFARTLEFGHWLIGGCAAIAVMAAASSIATGWINAETLSTEEVAGAVGLMGVLLALQWPVNLYQAGLLGVQRQVLLNAIRIPAVTASGLGAVVLLHFVSADIRIFFWWQIFVAAVHVAVMHIAFWTTMPRSASVPRVRLRTLRSTMAFTGGMTGIGLFGIVLVQMDKVVLSKLLPLEDFGYYVLGWMVASALHVFIIPVFSTIFPRMSTLVATGDEHGLRQLYRASTQLMAALVLPAAAVLAFFSYPIVTIWTGNPDTAQHVAPIVALLAIGTAINGVMHVPYALQLAYGWTGIGLGITIAKVAIFLPLLIVAGTRFGATGAAAVWLALNLVYLAVAVPLTHRRILQGEALRWLLRGVGVPALAAVVVAAVARLVFSDSGNQSAAAVYVIAVALIGIVASLSVSGSARSVIAR